MVPERQKGSGNLPGNSNLKEKPPVEKKEGDKMIEINFGWSDWGRSRPDSSSPGENIIRISENEPFPTLPSWVTKEYDSLMKLPAQEMAILGHSSISVKRDRSTAMNENVELIFIWVEMRSEWAVISHSACVEGAGLKDESFDGPFALDQMCADKILEVYVIPNQKFTPDEVRRMNPEKLKQNSERDSLEDDSTKPVRERIGTAVKKFLKDHPDYKFKHVDTSRYHSGHEWSDDDNRDSSWFEMISGPNTQKILVTDDSISYSSNISGGGPEDPLLTNLLNKLQTIRNPKPADKV